MLLVIFGILYNAVVAWLLRRGYAEGYMGLIVAAGCGVTLLGVAVIDTRAATLSLWAFAASGTPMMVGSIARYVLAREAEKRAIREEIERRLEQVGNYGH